MVSPVQVYHMNNNLKGSVCDEHGICRINFKFEWLNPEAVCSSNFVCTALEGLIRYHHRFFDQVGYETMYTSNTNKHFLLNNVTVRPTKIMNRFNKNWAYF